MNLSNILDKNLILLDLDCKNKDEVLTTMAENLKEHQYVSNSEKFLKDIYAREELGQTGIGNYIAIPHGQSDSVMKTTISVAKLNDAIEWESLDNSGAKVIILFVVENTTEFANEHLKLLAEVARKLASEVTLEKLLDARTKEDIISCFI
jgi:PTS system, fructose subfamily, IIA component